MQLCAHCMLQDVMYQFSGMENPQWQTWPAIVFIAEENADSSHHPESSTDAIENYCVLKTDGKIHLIVTTCHIVIGKIKVTRSCPV